MHRKLQMNPQHPGAPDPPRAGMHLRQLLARKDLDFICAAYQVLLGRSPDLPGCAHYLQAIRAGVSRSRILVQLARSAERRGHRSHLSGLGMLVLRYHLARVPGIGWLGRVMLGWEGESVRDRRRRATEYREWRIRPEGPR